MKYKLIIVMLFIMSISTLEAELISAGLLLFLMPTSNVEEEHISAGFIQFYNDDQPESETTILFDKNKTAIDLFILQFTTWDNITIKYNTDEILAWGEVNNNKILVGLTGAGSKIDTPKGMMNRDNTLYWDQQDPQNILNLVNEDMKIVNEWSTLSMGHTAIAGFYSSYEPLSNLYDVGSEYDDYLVALGNKLEEWGNDNDRNVILAFSGVIHVKKDDRSDSIYIENNSEKFSKRIINLLEKILCGKKRLTLVFILQDGAGERQVNDNDLSTVIKPFFEKIHTGLQDINHKNIQFWPLVEAFDCMPLNNSDNIDCKSRPPTSQSSFKKRLENISGLGWNYTETETETETEKYKIVVFDLPKFNNIAIP